MKNKNHSNQESLLDKIIVFSFPDWISTYEISIKIYGSDESYIYKVIKNNKKLFRRNRQGQIQSKSKIIVDKICDKITLTKMERKTLKSLLDNESFRLLIGLSKLDSIFKIECFIKTIFSVIKEAQEHFTLSIFNDKEMVKFLDSNRMITVNQTVRKEFLQRGTISEDVRVGNFKEVELMWISCVLLIYRSFRSKLIGKLS
ncbi:Uncharacterised protein [uncultured archaeon]|nr:Uncharacterised protein [uncultured archaeon]